MSCCRIRSTILSLALGGVVGEGRGEERRGEVDISFYAMAFYFISSGLDRLRVEVMGS